MQKPLWAALLAVIFSSPVWAQELPDDVRAGILARCRASMGEYGAAMVRACAEQDADAYRALQDYSSEWASIVTRCRSSMGEYGWAMVQACADQDIEAEKALQDF